jgi:S-(hydroxymethyl)glutathione dehydrogenase/alcohol dehydrogenase
MVSVRFVGCSYLGIELIYSLEGSNVAVFGCGCIGLGCINAARVKKAGRIIAVDTNPKKEAWAKKFGGDNVEFVNPTQLPEGKRIQDHLIDITDGGLDFTFDATGNVSGRRTNW